VTTFEEDDLFDIADGKPFNPMYPGEEGIDRDQWQRPLIKPDPRWPGGIWKDGPPISGRKPRPYTRCTTLSGAMDQGYGLGWWMRRQVALSIARRPDLQALLCTLTYADGREIDAICEEAMTRAKDDTENKDDPDNTLIAAARGTAFHRFSTPGGPIIDPTFGPRLSAYALSAAMMFKALDDADLEIVSSERFVVVDHLESGGTYDHLLLDRRTGKVKMADKKTGKHYWPQHITQVDTYASGKHYDPVTGKRSGLHPDFDPTEGFILSTNLDTGGCEVYAIDLTENYAETAKRVHTLNTSKMIKSLVSLRK
jgi:hypothetical protein